MWIRRAGWLGGWLGGDTFGVAMASKLNATFAPSGWRAEQKSAGKIFCHVISGISNWKLKTGNCCNGHHSTTTAATSSCTTNNCTTATPPPPPSSCKLRLPRLALLLFSVAAKCGYNNLCTCNDRQQSVQEARSRHPRRTRKK